MGKVDAAVMDYLRVRQRERGLTPELSGQTAVFDGGLLDSLSLLELVAVVEDASGQTVDMLRFDPSEVETAAELCTELSSALSG